MNDVNRAIDKKEERNIDRFGFKYLLINDLNYFSFCS